MKRDRRLQIRLALALCAGLLLSACASAQVVHTDATPTPEATAMQTELTFYADHSGARDNYWHIEGEYLTCDLTNKGYMLDALCNNHLMDTGAALGLTEIPYEHMGENAYVEATRALFSAVFGEDAVKLVKNNATGDGHYCTMHVLMNDGTAYEMGFYDGVINGCTFFSRVEDRWGARPGWDADWFYRNHETGETFYQDW